MIIGTKEGMTQLFTDEGRCVPATIVKATAATVMKVKADASDGYNAIQVGYGQQKPQRLNRAVKGVIGDSGHRGLVEFRLDESSSLKEGDTLEVSAFNIGDKVTASAVSKAKGFQGVVKRWNFGGGPKSHGQKHTLRAPGSIGAGGVQRVFKGTKMGGRTGGKKVTVKNLNVAFVDKDNSLIYVEGAIPGRKGTLVELVHTPVLKKKAN